MQQTTNKKRVNVLIISAIAALSLSLFLYYSSKDPNANIEITELVTKYNKNCPLVIQEGIRLDSVSLPEEQVVQYNLTLEKVEKKTADVSVIQKEIEKSLVSTAKANPGLKTFRDYQFTLIYNYSDKNKAFLFDIKITPEQYK